MLTPVSLGGFGLLDLNELSDSLDLRSYGRLVVSMHPFLKQLATLINNNDFFNVTIDAPVDNKLRKSIALLNRDRRVALNWPSDILLTNTNLVNVFKTARLTHYLTPQGKQSVSYFMIHRRRRNVTLEQVTPGELDSVSRYLIYPELVPVFKELLRINLPTIPSNINPNEIYPLKTGKMFVAVSSLSSKTLRLNFKLKYESIICIYKQGLILDPGEVVNWTKSIRRLTSNRHRNIILRIAHGDVYSNERLSRFGLINDPKCNNCNEAVESVNHRIADCPKAVQAWLKLNEARLELGFDALTDFSYETILGVKQKLSKVELALNAELLHRLTTFGGNDYESLDPEGGKIVSRGRESYPLTL